MKNKYTILAILPMILSVSGCKAKTIEFDYIFTAQPVVSATNSTIFKNVQSDFMTKSDGKLLTQASVFVKDDIDANKASVFLHFLQGDIVNGIATPGVIKAGIEKVGEVSEQTNKYGVPGAMATKVTTANNGFGLGFNYAKDIKSDIQSFVNVLTNNTIGNISDDVIFNPLSSFEGELSGLKILAPTGAPAVAFYGFSEYSDFTTTSNPQSGLIPQFQAGNYDVIVAPTHGGLTQIIKNNAHYKIAATITFGNFYLVATGKDADGVLNDSDRVLIFQENDVPGKVFKYTYGDLNLSLTAVGAVSETKLVIENGGILAL